MMQNLSESAGKMHDIVDSIQSIASQTNLLALNAAIEARSEYSLNIVVCKIPKKQHLQEM